MRKTFQVLLFSALLISVFLLGNSLQSIFIAPRATFRLNVSIKPENVTLTKGESETFFALVLNGSGTYEYEWKVNGSITSHDALFEFGFKEPAQCVILSVSVRDSDGNWGYDSALVYDPIATGSYILDVPIPVATYSIGEFTNSSAFAVNGSNWDCFITSTNGSKIFEECAGDGEFIKVGSGTFSIDYDVLLTYEGLTIEGSGAGSTIFEIGENGGFTFSRSAGDPYRDNNQIRNIGFDGQDVAMYGVRSRSDASGFEGNVIMRNFELTNCHFTNWGAEGAIPVDMANIEESRITDNMFYGGTTKYQIYVWSDLTYQCGNNHIERNFIVTGASGSVGTAGICINSTGNDPEWDVGAGSMWIQDNHFLGTSFDGEPFDTMGIIVHAHEKATGSDQNRIIGNRAEGCGLVKFIDDGASNCSRKNIIANNHVTSNKGIVITLGEFSRHNEVYGNILTNSNASAYFIWENYSIGSVEWNKVYDNTFAGNAQFEFGPYCEVRDNSYLNPLGVKETAYRKNTHLSYYGDDAGWGNGTKLRVHTTDLYLTVSGGTATNITLWDYSSNVVQTNISSCLRLLCPFRTYLSIAHTGGDGDKPSVVWEWG